MKDSEIIDKYCSSSTISIFNEFKIGHQEIFDKIKNLNFGAPEGFEPSTS